MLRLFGTVTKRPSLSSISLLTRHLPIYHTVLIITFSFSLHLSFSPSLRLISSTNHSRLSLLAPLHSRFSGLLKLALFSFHITTIITVSLISSHIISYHLLYGLLCSIVSENKPPSSFTHAWLAFTGTSNLLTCLRYYYLISSSHI